MRIHEINKEAEQTNVVMGDENTPGQLISLNMVPGVAQDQTSKMLNVVFPPTNYSFFRAL